MLPLQQAQFLQRRQDWRHYASCLVGQAKKSETTVAFEQKIPSLFDSRLRLRTVIHCQYTKLYNTINNFVFFQLTRTEMLLLIDGTATCLC